MLAVDVEKELGAFKLGVRFAAAGGATALFGHSGAGKTSVINMIAGLLTPDRGSIALDDTVLFAAAAGINVPPHRRRIGYVFQEGRLFPHLSVRQNLDYGRRMSGRPRDGREFERIAALLDIGHLLERRPRLLSGGERQRVAVGRALLMRPRLLLLDEPLASLDAARKRKFSPISSACVTMPACRSSTSAIRRRKCAASPRPSCSLMPAVSWPPAGLSFSKRPTRMPSSDADGAGRVVLFPSLVPLYACDRKFCARRGAEHLATRRFFLLTQKS